MNKLVIEVHSMVKKGGGEDRRAGEREREREREVRRCGYKPIKQSNLAKSCTDESAMQV
jgi:hypothetical protein